MPVARNGGISLRYQSVGEGPAVMLHHGGGFRLESWELAGWVDSLATDHEVVSFDARGNGESDKPTDPDDYRLDLLVGDVLAVADACEAQKVHYLGWSLGGKVGWGLADQAQDRLSSLALIGAEPETSGETASAMIALVEQGPDAVADAMSQMWQMPDWALEQQRRNDREAVLAYFRSSWPDLSHVPDQLRVPSLLMCGTKDEVRDAMHQAARSEESHFVELEGEDHVTSFLSARARTTYRDFLQDLDVHGAGIPT
jgi:pimeloyl-ACP methyl ester carboxylesterase